MPHWHLFSAIEFLLIFYGLAFNIITPVGFSVKRLMEAGYFAKKKRAAIAHSPRYSELFGFRQVNRCGLLFYQACAENIDNFICFFDLPSDHPAVIIGRKFVDFLAKDFLLFPWGQSFPFFLRETAQQNRGQNQKEQ